MRYQTQIVDNSTGTASIGVAMVQRPDGRWQEIGRTNAYKEYPRAVRARAAADNLCREHRKAVSMAARGVSFAVPMQITHI